MDEESARQVSIGGRSNWCTIILLYDGGRWDYSRDWGCSEYGGLAATVDRDGGAAGLAPPGLG